MSFWSKIKSFFGIAVTEVETHPQVVADVVQAVVSKTVTPAVEADAAAVVADNLPKA